MATRTQIRRRGLASLILGGLVATVLFAAVAFASDADVSVADVTTPTGSVTLAPGGSGAINIRIDVSGNQVGTATFKVYRTWTLSGGTFTGSNPETFEVAPQSGGTTTTFNTTGSVVVGAAQADGTFELEVGIFDVTNTNSTGAKLAEEARTLGSYEVIVETPAASYTIDGFFQPIRNDVVNGAKAGSTIPIKFNVLLGDVIQGDTSLVSSLVQKTPCVSGTETDMLEAAELSSGNTSLRFDADAPQMIFNWKTPKTAGCYKVTLTVQGGASKSATFELK